MGCLEELQGYLDGEGVSYVVQEHPLAYTAQEVAAAEHVSGYQLAKVVVLKADDRFVLAVLGAPHRVDLEKMAGLVGHRVGLATESEFEGLFPGCEAGAMPPLGNLYGLEVWVDESLARQAEITFTACDHRHTFRIAYADFERLSNPKVAQLALAPGH